ncbi:putative quinol monooxygenase [Flavobacterium suzhouense]|uniref:Quinol monooxygenase n=1 Tax=Flavobacterium suzhouense TaxID=1529638 RepID=A0ABW5NYC4_9FLAO
MQINITAIIKALPEKAEEMKALLLKLVEGSTKEAACIQYDLHQSAEEPNVFIFHEIWRDADSLAEHTQTQHFLKFVNDSSPLLAEPLTVYKTNRV